MNTRCNFYDSAKIRALLNEKYGADEFEVVPQRHLSASLNDIIISNNGELIIFLEATSDGYRIKEIGRYVLLDFIGEICQYLAL